MHGRHARRRGQTGGDAGDIDLDDLRAKIAEHADALAAMMVTYPSTHGVFEEHIAEVCALVHDAGGQVYVDGANLNALVGLARPGQVRRRRIAPEPAQDVLHPARRWRPGRRPGRRCARTWRRTCPNHPLAADGRAGDRSRRRSRRRRGARRRSCRSPGRTCALMGPDGLTRATGVAILSANYVATRLRAALPGAVHRARAAWWRTSASSTCGRSRKATGVTVDDVAKRLIDYGFHAPTMSFPVAGTLMVEPTESEDLAELDRFVDAMIAIKAEIDAGRVRGVAAGGQPARQRAAHGGVPDRRSGPTRTRGPRRPTRMGSIRRPKYWPPVRRIDGAYGDRNLVCACPPVADYA